MVTGLCRNVSYSANARTKRAHVQKSKLYVERGLTREHASNSGTSRKANMCRSSSSQISSNASGSLFAAIAASEDHRLLKMNRETREGTRFATSIS